MDGLVMTSFHEPMRLHSWVLFPSDSYKFNKSGKLYSDLE
jgi:hypothetical protein